MRIARVKNWNSFQHYKDRSPPWIKLHRSLVDNYEFCCLPLASKALAPMLWLLAAESQDGSFRADADWLAFRLRFSQTDVEEGLIPLFSEGFIEDASKPLARRKRVATPETETEREKEKASCSTGVERFAEIWLAFPRKVGKQAALKAFNKLAPDDAMVVAMLAAIGRQARCEQWVRDDGRFIPHLATWINGRRWEDETEVSVTSAEQPSYMAGAL